MAAEEQFIDIDRKVHSRRLSKGSLGASGEGRETRRERREPGPGSASAVAWWRAALAEGVGTALLVLASCLPAAYGAPPTHAALAAGAAVAMLVQCFDHLSYAMFNPAVSVAGAVMARISWRRCVIYLCAQLAGAAAGARLLALFAPHPALAAVCLGDSEGDAGWCACSSCVTSPAAGLGAGRAALLEGVLGACVALANCAAWDARAPALGDSWPLRIAATITALSLAAGGATGASMNPARSFGPALCAGGRAWRHHWVYWAGPLGGSLSAALLYRALWSLPAPAPVPAPAPTPATAPT